MTTTYVTVDSSEYAARVNRAWLYSERVVCRVGGDEFELVNISWLDTPDGLREEFQWGPARTRNRFPLRWRARGALRRWMARLRRQRGPLVRTWDADFNHVATLANGERESWPHWARRVTRIRPPRGHISWFTWARCIAAEVRR